MAELTEISGIEARRLYLAAKEAEAKYGRSIEEVLVELTYNAGSDQAKLGAIRLYFAIIFNSGLELEDLDRHTSLSQIISLHRECKVDSQY